MAPVDLGLPGRVARGLQLGDQVAQSRREDQQVDGIETWLLAHT
jgi:hypothetical protein